MLRGGWAVLALCALLLLPVPGTAGSAATEEKTLEIGGSVMTYPVITGMEDTALQEAVNLRIAEDGNLTGYLTRISQLLSGGTLRVGWTGGVLGDDVFSCAISAEGAVEGPRPGFVWTWSNIDLTDGHEITLSELFTEEEAARAAMEELLEWTVAPGLSAHLANSALTPLPEGFFLEPAGLTLLYPASRLSTLHDRAGAVRLGWHELREDLNLEEGGILSRIGAADMIRWTENSRTEIARAAEAGALPGIPAELGASLRALTDRYGLLTDPDLYEGGRMFALEGAAFRDVFLLTDGVGETWDGSVVTGIRMDRGCLFGLCTGQTSREEWRSALGEPDNTVEFDAERAEANRTVPGSCDYYRFGKAQLRLYSGEDEVLYSVILTE